MKITKFQLREVTDFNWKEIDLDNNVCILFSKQNSTGKTTTMRAILYALGFSIPNTELVKFANYEFKVTLIRNQETLIVARKDEWMSINDNEFDLPTEEFSAHSYLFGIHNPEILANLLGAIYFDQEKGWTLLNRGTIIGTNRFSIEAFFRGLKEDESNESYQMVAQINTLGKKIAQYKLMMNIAEYQKETLYDHDKALDYQPFDQKLEMDLAAKEIELSKVESNLLQLNDLIKGNKSFITYIEKQKIYIKSPTDGEIILVSKQNLLDYKNIFETNEARRSMLLSKRNALKKQISKIESLQEEQMKMSNITTLDEALTQRLSDIKGIDSVQVKAILSDLKKQKKKLTDALETRTKNNNQWIDKAYQIISTYTKELNVPFNYRIDIFTNNLKSKSGAILQKMVFSYKLAYIQLLSEKLGYPIPIFCDSPSGRELEQKTINEMMIILKRDFSNHQIIMASIYNYKNIFDTAKIITMDGTLFDKKSLFN